ncbi:MAG: TatD family hydrolase, partial [Deltaproteobacteria bacterium]|nr:TatD family hydrolase [Deltaproteobacteria bacterium]
KHLDLDALDFLEEQARHEKVVALGEMGLDFYRNRSPRQDQIRCFRAQLDLAGSLQLPVVIHDRDAHEESVNILREENGGDFGGVIHCFSGDAAMAFACIDMGFHISIPGTVTFKNARSLHEVVRKIPLASLLIETDCPFLTPVPNRGKRNEPAYVVRVAEQVAALKKVSLEEVAETTTRNARTVFGLPEEPKQ